MLSTVLARGDADDMHTSEHVGWSGLITVTVVHSDGRRTVETFPNLITDAGLDLLRDILDGTVAAGEITWVAFGTGTTTPAAGDTQLGAEQFRKAVTKQQPAGVGKLDTSLYLAPGDANSFEIREIGWFAGAATAAAGSGVLVARVLWQHQKTNLESVQIDRRDTIGRA